MENIIRLSPQNFVSIAIMSGAAYLGVVGAKLLIDKIKGKLPAARSA